MLHYCTPARLAGQSDEEYANSIEQFDRHMDRLGVLMVASFLFLPAVVVALLAIVGAI